jgi:hypothetical protein
MTTEGEELRSQMAVLRASLGHELQHTVSGLRTMVDWREFVRRHPWACLGAAALAGFAMIPTKSTVVVQADANSIANFARGKALRVNTTPKRTTTVESLARVAGQMAIRAATAYVTRRITESLSGVRHEADAARNE